MEIQSLVRRSLKLGEYEWSVKRVNVHQGYCNEFNYVFDGGRGKSGVDWGDWRIYGPDGGNEVGAVFRRRWTGSALAGVCWM